MTTTQPIVLSLLEVDQGSLPLVGGKGANLGELMHAGLAERVPPGFCVTTLAYACVAADAQIEPLVVELEQTPADSIERLAAQAGRIRRLIESTPIPTAMPTFSLRRAGL